MIKRKRPTKFTAHPITSVSGFLAELEHVKKQGYSVSTEEFQTGMRSIAFPIIDPLGEVRAALAAVGMTALPVWENDLNHLLRLVKDAASEISRLERQRV